MLRIGIDTGGTFTDFVLIRDDEVEVYKIPSTPDNPAKAFLQGLKELGVNPNNVNITHGSTVATNALIERRGAPTAMITTDGFADIIEIGRQTRCKIYDFNVDRPEPLIPADRRYGIPERTLYTGEIEERVNADSVNEILKQIKKENVRSLAICFLHSYANPENEHRVWKLAKDLGIHVSASSIILPEYREYERFSTTVVNAYVSPLMAAYLSQVKKELKGSQLNVMQSNGGSISAEVAGEESVRTILSGPAGGALGAHELAKAAGYANIISFDMGGTSTDVSLCPGKIQKTTESIIAGCPIKVPVIDIHTVGAGGGSIAYLDEGGALKVGPKSAGADPGPICYGKGEDLTVTDANVYLGRLHPDFFLGGKMKLDVGRLKKTIREFSGNSQMSGIETAEGILKVANATMERAIRVISVEKGFDPREFVLVSFGGAGPLHACELARNLSIPKVMVPTNPGVLSAMGMILSDVVKDYSQTVLMKSSETDSRILKNRYSDLMEIGYRQIRKEGFRKRSMNMEKFLDMRYVGQSYELTLPFVDNFTDEFHKLHHKVYGYSDPIRATEIVNLRITVTGFTAKPKFKKNRRRKGNGKNAVMGVADIVFEGKVHKSKIYERKNLKSGDKFKGPALIVEFSATTVLPPDFRCEVDGLGNLVIT